MARRRCPRVGDLVKLRGTPPDAGYNIASEGIHVWVRFFDRADDESYDVYSRRDMLEVLSSARSN